MSRAFLKDDAVEDQVFIPARAPLPPEAKNYVTPRGMRLLEEELAALEAERARLQAGDREDHDRVRALTLANGQHAQLKERLATAVVVDPAKQPQDEVRFGATVTFRILKGPRAGKQQRITIVGVDEAGSTPDRVAFTSPIARALTGLAEGETAELPAVRGEPGLKVVRIAYASS